MPNNFKPRIEQTGEKKLVGKSLVMNLSVDQSMQLWKSFMPGRNAITNKLSTDVISMSIYNKDYFNDFNPTNYFEKWAAVEVSAFGQLPMDMRTYILPKGLYAVFDYTGPGNDHSIFDYIFRTWLPAADYVLDNRPHFEVLGEKYKHADSASGEEIWIPIRIK